MIDFLIIGAQRGGTQSFYDYLLQHPSIVPAIRPDIQFFDQHYERGIDWYVSQFPLLSGYYGSKRPENCLTGEASPFYLHHPLVPHRLHQHCPKAKLIVLLRNPTDRAYSHYRQAVRSGKEFFPFMTALKIEAKRSEKGNQRLHENPNIYSEKNLFTSYIAHGIYVLQIKRWQALFPTKQLLFIRSEDYFSDPIPHIVRAYQFLGLTPFQPHRVAPPPVPFFQYLTDQTRARIDRVFKPSNDELYRLLNWSQAWESEPDVHVK